MSLEAATELIAAQPLLQFFDSADTAITTVVLTLLLGVPVLGYVFMVIDIRRYLRSLRRALVVVTRAVQQVPYWALLERPTCLREFDLQLPCSEADVMAAYRDRAKDLHPDRGGDLQQFLHLQKQLEEALRLVRSEDEPGI